MVGERTAEESSPPGVVEEPGVSRRLHLKVSNFFSRGVRFLFWGFAGLWDYEFRLLVGKIELFGLLMPVAGTNVCYGHVSLTAGQNDPFFSCTEHDEVIL